MTTVDEWLTRQKASSQCVLLDGVTTPANMGMLIRSAVASGINGIIIPRHGSPEVSPLVIKASAGTAFSAPIVRASTPLDAVEALVRAGYTVFGLRGDIGNSLYEIELPERAVWVLGNESAGVSQAVAEATSQWASIPMSPQAESLNVACAGTVVMFELQRRQMAKLAPTGA
jgi:23S rRNA (guanosine2251-2'-O)-methyltransferase